MNAPRVTVVGAGLAGCECAWQLAERGVQVRLVDQKPGERTEAQRSADFAELVCSNSFRSASLDNAVGLLKEEMRRAGSVIIAVADVTAVPAGGALAVDRKAFSRGVTSFMRSHANIEVVEERIDAVPDPADGPVVVATGPLTAPALAADLEAIVGRRHLAYYDAISPVVWSCTIDWERVFVANRWGRGSDDAYVNCPLDRAQYESFVAALLAAEKVPLRPFEEPRYFEGCLPIEVMAERGPMTLAFGPMRPVGLIDPRTGRRPFAVVQLRPEDRHRVAHNIVGFQTRMKQPEQKRVFRMIPGLEHAEFLRFGSVHRNTFVDAPRVLDDTLELRARPGVWLAGQITGVEGYVESAACGLCVGILVAARVGVLDGVRDEADARPPPTTALGALLDYLREPRDDFQPSNVMWSMLPPLPASHEKLAKGERHAVMARRALAHLEPWLERIGARRLVERMQRVHEDCGLTRDSDTDPSIPSAVLADADPEHGGRGS
ncbi:MAG: methylenetetrahydrofolate--tRNA-(uracil(54)-C(5))-methyltransferase (FADH(2)-oxidizing) TrmFO [Myxococcota bacterium]|nr:methylenetetrahydrofolate--tRNA-(uracil(54)-C(5))-methyltransferase (FADH(2)-oxidizing) TrmFO [Myxococcota bacterium]MDW8363912.1 methylenetetrahydrofolate--tRNA-(uracil(54)-C(5))-methyltransferase (FADH(2)-oxidizing) TrmFO [Myxococcales bacterium]